MLDQSTWRHQQPCWHLKCVKDYNASQLRCRLGRSLLHQAAIQYGRFLMHTYVLLGQ